MKTEIVICEKANDCDLNLCADRIPHEKTIQCDKTCQWNAKCIPVLDEGAGI